MVDGRLALLQPIASTSLRPRLSGPCLNLARPLCPPFRSIGRDHGGTSTSGSYAARYDGVQAKAATLPWPQHYQQQDYWSEAEDEPVERARRRRESSARVALQTSPKPLKINLDLLLARLLTGAFVCMKVCADRCSDLCAVSGADGEAVGLQDEQGGGQATLSDRSRGNAEAVPGSGPHRKQGIRVAWQAAC